MTTTPEADASLKVAVRTALSALRSCYHQLDLKVTPDGQGGAWLEMLDVPLGKPYAQTSTFLVCLLPFNLPGSDIYPIFVRPDLERLDGQPLGPAFQVTQLSWPAELQPRPVIQVSRRTRGAFASQTAAQKIAKVLDWMSSL